MHLVDTAVDGRLTPEQAAAVDTPPQALGLHGWAGFHAQAVPEGLPFCRSPHGQHPPRVLPVALSCPPGRMGLTADSAAGRMLR